MRQMNIAISLLAALVAALPAADRATERRVADLARQVADEGLDLERRYNAALQLGKIGTAAKSAVPALLRALRDPDRRVWQMAAESLRRVDPAGPATAAALGALLLDWKPDEH